MSEHWIYYLLAASVAYVVYRTVRGRLRYRRLREEIEAEAVLQQERWVLTGFSFPMIKKLTFTHVVLSRRRLVVAHWLTLNMLLQAPLGAEGAAGTEMGRFEIEEAGGGCRLLLRTTLRGGGKIRFRVKDADAWLRGIVENQ